MILDRTLTLSQHAYRSQCRCDRLQYERQQLKAGCANIYILPDVRGWLILDCVYKVLGFRFFKMTLQIYSTPYQFNEFLVTYSKLFL